MCALRCANTPFLLLFLGEAACTPITPSRDSHALVQATVVVATVGRGFETRRTGRWGFIIVVDTGGGFIFVSEVPVSSTQFLLRVGRAT